MGGHTPLFLPTAADFGDEIREYIANLASASAGATQEQAASTISQTTQFSAMAAQIKSLTDAVAKLASAKENQTPNTAKGEEKLSYHKKRKLQATKLRNMGGYCHSHGFHPVRLNHNSRTSSHKKEDHKDKATWCNWLGGDVYWPTAKRTTLEQHEDPAWKGKTAPTV